MNKKILLIIDLQKSFMDEDGAYEKVKEYCISNRNLYDAVLITVFQNNFTENDNYIKHLDWHSCENVSLSDSELYSSGDLASENIHFEIKHGYSSDKIFNIADADDHIDIVGCDSDACVLATAFKLWDRGYNFRILSDYIYTTADEFDNETVLKLLKRNFGKCIS